jgi:hypothetical protein
MDDIVVHFRFGLVGLMASRWRKLGPRRAGEASTAQSLDRVTLMPLLFRVHRFPASFPLP